MSLSCKTFRQSPLRNSIVKDSGSESLTSDESDNNIMSSRSSPALHFTSRQGSFTKHREGTHKNRHRKSKRRQTDSGDMALKRPRISRSKSPRWNYTSSFAGCVEFHHHTRKPPKLDSPQRIVEWSEIRMNIHLPWCSLQYRASKQKKNHRADQEGNR
ncbi:hypothetical protein M427DRAFT_325323 [Gonapodya prolifera JEL478]|uniref:Uncharacterized protein n=1 Tax=Gonapodya prolifera (strain JEL478) TaxID=1344416 RepID=A0A139AG83_GONPJ|nr:hypothetical protein M427DRAFT_325323 [Gonapodya prolifera JEL478]|eukprot:KXS15445.1 hypothetical protein M427DRAFT_325323 [Gonapodya prolifera JEL478]